MEKENVKKTIRWKRFSRKSTSVFCSMHKVINIGVLSVAIIANADVKAKTAHPSGNISLSTMPETYLDDVEVTADSSTTLLNIDGQYTTVLNNQDVTAAASHSINDLLKQIPTIDIRQRGGFGVQTDISIRGTSADQTNILINGIDISSPQTGHLSADFPLPSDIISKIELTESNTGNTSTININIRPDTLNQVTLQTIAGYYGLLESNALLNAKYKKTLHLASISGSRSDGAVKNSDFHQGKFYYIGELNIKRLHAEWQWGYSRQSFGANTFYSAAYDNQWERTNRLLNSFKWETKTPVCFAGSLSWMRNYDHFQLIRDHSTGENYHRTDVLNFNPEISHRWEIGKTCIGGYFRYENINSTNLGNPLGEDSIRIFNSNGKYYTKNKDRDILTIYLKHNFLFRRWNLNVGTRAYKNFDISDRLHFLPFLNAKIEMTKEWTLFASWNNARRTPTFTELYYKSQTNEGNKDLKSEFTSTASISSQVRKKGINTEISTYYIYGKDMIDWVMYTPDDVYHSTNFRLNNIGVELHNTISFHEWFDCIPLQLYLGYNYIHQERKDEIEIFKSNYALEYVKHKFVTQLTIQPTSSLMLSLHYRCIARNGGYIIYQEKINTGVIKEYEPYGIMDFKANYRIKRLNLFGEINNLLNNKDYYDYGNVPQPGLIWKIGLIYHFQF